MSMSSKNRNVKESKTFVLRVDDDRRWQGTRNCEFFHFFSFWCCWFVCWLLAISGSVQWRGAPMGKEIASGSWDNTMKIWDLQSGDCQLRQRRLAISRLQVPNLDGFVDTAAGDFFFIGTPRHRKDPEIVRSQDTNQQKQRGKHWGRKNLEKNLEKKNVLIWAPGLSARSDRALELEWFFFQYVQEN